MQATSQDAKRFIDVRALSKKYGNNTVLHDINLTIGAGEIVGLIGPNGAGKSTLLKALMGLIKYSGDLSVFGQDPFSNRTQLLTNMSYIADVASLPGWMKVSDILHFVAETHPKFDKSRALALLQDTPIHQESKIETLSKGMKTRLHLVIILSINTDFLVLDEPTLGLDVLVRRDFQDRLVQDYYNQQRSILITTHQIDEIESILTRVVFIKEGRIILDIKKSELKTRYSKLIVKQNVVFTDADLQPIYQRNLPEHTELLFEDVDASRLSQYGEVVTPSLEDLFVATNSSPDNSFSSSINNTPVDSTQPKPSSGEGF
ncbi:MAG: ABC-2 type transport system ATP-binding protein [Cryomorphaceae bacterium]|jgi:ABC-2 type transport system ATP-binding protein